jgi:hypothetical protein
VTFVDDKSFSAEIDTAQLQADLSSQAAPSGSGSGSGSGSTTPSDSSSSDDNPTLTDSST